MQESLNEELSRLRRELKNLERILAEGESPFDHHTLEIARAKVAKLLMQIEQLESVSAVVSDRSSIIS
jgi:hypothetical protein